MMKALTGAGSKTAAVQSISRGSLDKERAMRVFAGAIRSVVGWDGGRQMMVFYG